MPFVTSAAGRVQSIKIEYNLVDGCNYTCRECSHFSPFMAHKSADLEAFDADLRALEPVYHVRRFRFVGGEPFLHNSCSTSCAASAERHRRHHRGGHERLAPRPRRRRRLPRGRLVQHQLVPGPAVRPGETRPRDRRCRRFGTQLKVRKVDEFRMMQLDEPHHGRPAAPARSSTPARSPTRGTARRSMRAVSTSARDRSSPRAIWPEANERRRLAGASTESTCTSRNCSSDSRDI